MAQSTPKTFGQLVYITREKIAFPEYSLVPDSKICTELVAVLDELIEELNLSAEFWKVRQTIINANPGDDFVAITADNFGIPFAVETYDPSNPSLDTREIEIVNEQELVRYMGGGDPGPDGVQHSAEGCAFLDDPKGTGKKVVRFGPKPAFFSQYLCLYEPLVDRPQQLTDAGNFPLPQFEDYACSIAAKKLLGYCEWMDDKFKQITTSLDFTISRGDVRFNRRRRKPKQESNFRALPFGRSRWMGGGGRSSVK